MVQIVGSRWGRGKLEIEAGGASPGVDLGHCTGAAMSLSRTVGFVTCSVSSDVLIRLRQEFSEEVELMQTLIPPAPKDLRRADRSGSVLLTRRGVDDALAGTSAFAARSTTCSRLASPAGEQE